MKVDGCYIIKNKNTEKTIKNHLTIEFVENLILILFDSTDKLFYRPILLLGTGSTLPTYEDRQLDNQITGFFLPCEVKSQESTEDTTKITLVTSQPFVYSEGMFGEPYEIYEIGVELFPSETGDHLISRIVLNEPLTEGNTYEIKYVLNLDINR